MLLLHPGNNLQGGLLGAAAGAIGNRGKQRFQLIQAINHLEKGRPILPFFGWKILNRQKRPAADQTLTDFHD